MITTFIAHLTCLPVPILYTVHLAIIFMQRLAMLKVMSVYEICQSNLPDVCLSRFSIFYNQLIQLSGCALTDSESPGRARCTPGKIEDKTMYSEFQIVCAWMCHSVTANTNLI